MSLSQISRNGAPTVLSDSISGEKQKHGKGQKSLRQSHCWVVTGGVFECEFISFKSAFIYLKILDFSLYISGDPLRCQDAGSQSSAQLLQGKCTA